MRLSPTLLLLTSGAALRADGLTDLRTALQKMQATQPVQASATCQSWSRSGKGGKEKITQGEAKARLSDGSGGLQLEWDKAELDRIESAKKAKNSGPGAALELLDGERAKRLLDAAPDLLEDLKGAALLEDRQDTWNGHPARLIQVKFDDSDMDAEDRKHLKTFTHTMKVWMGADGAPLASLEQVDLKGSFFLISFESHSTIHRTFVRAGDRLVVVHSESEESGSGAGQTGQSKKVIDLRL